MEIRSINKNNTYTFKNYNQQNKNISFGGNFSIEKNPIYFNSGLISLRTILPTPVSLFDRVKHSIVNPLQIMKRNFVSESNQDD